MIRPSWKTWPPKSVSRRGLNNGKLLSSVPIWVDGMNRQIVMRLREFPAAIFFAFHGGLVREKLFFNFTAMSGGRNIFVGDDNAVFPPRVFPRVKARPIDCIGRHITQILLAVQGRDLIFLEE